MINVLGLMSGTSCDGLDCCDAQIELDENYNFNWKINKFQTIDYTTEEKAFLLSTRNSNNNKGTEEKKVTRIFVDKINQFNYDISKFDLISCHGHTVRHIDKVMSKQFLDASILFNEYKIPIAYNFRKKDIELGGNGAPLMPFLDYLLFSENKKNIITLNIGGISNITYLPSSCEKHLVSGFDTGPGMSLVDKSVEILFNDLIDKDSKYSKNGNVCEELLNDLMCHQYVKMTPPKSTDISEFGYELLKKIISNNNHLTKEDILRTIVQFTIDSILFNIKKFININNFELIYSGGGTSHPIIMKELNEKIEFCNSISSYGIDESIKEALLISVLGVAKVKNIPSSMPSVTGSNAEAVLGLLYE